jgi:outer membrane lipoprotein-sorting protein
MKHIVATISICLLVAGVSTADERGLAIATKYFARVQPSDTSASAVMTLTDKSGGKKVRELTMLTKDSPAGKFSFVEFSKPADVAGTKFLTSPVKGGDAEQRLYLPALKKVRKIASGDKGGDFVNSDLSYYDMQDRKLEDGNYTFVGENETLDDAAFAGKKFYKLEMASKDASSPYSRSVFWLSMDDYQPARIDAFDAKTGALVKTILFPVYEEQKGIKVPVQTLVINLKRGSKTLLQLNNLKVNSGLKDDVFSVKNLES